jgi:hypothetical protein
MSGKAQATGLHCQQMKRAAAVAAVLLLSAPPQVPGEVNVKTTGDLVSVSARKASITEVLQSLARSTGMTVEFEGQTPRNPVDITLVDEPLVSAVGRVLEGSGIDYAFTMDKTERKVLKLMVLGRSQAAAAGGARPPGSRPPVIHQLNNNPDDEEEQDLGDTDDNMPMDQFQEQQMMEQQQQEAPPPPVPTLPGAQPGVPNPGLPPAPATGPTPLPQETPRLPTYQPFATPTPAAAPAPPLPTPAPAPTPTPSVNQHN